MVCSVRFSTEEKAIIEQFALKNNITVSEFIRSAVMEKIEDELDVDICRKALKDFEKNPKTYTHEEVKKELGF